MIKRKKKNDTPGKKIKTKQKKSRYIGNSSFKTKEKRKYISILTLFFL